MVLTSVTVIQPMAKAATGRAATLTPSALSPVVVPSEPSEPSKPCRIGSATAADEVATTTYVGGLWGSRILRSR
jgi:hypothetical protein